MLLKNMNTKELISALRDFNLAEDFALIYWVSPEELTEEQMTELEDYMDPAMENEDGKYPINALDLVLAGVKTWELSSTPDTEWDTALVWEIKESVFSQLIKPYEHYLVFNCHARWTGAAGYKFADDLEDAFARNYEVSITPVAVSRGKKSLLLREASHDVPMGGSLLVIGLTDAEYNRYKDADFGTVAEFASKQIFKLS